MISNNYIPEKINDANAYLDGTRMIGVAASVDLPEINMKTGTVEGFGIGGEVDSPTIGQWESFEQAVQFNTLYSSAVDMLSPMSVVNLTFRAAQQVYDKSGGYDFKGLRVVEMARVKKFKPGKIEKSEKGYLAAFTGENLYGLNLEFITDKIAYRNRQAERRLQGQGCGYAGKGAQPDLTQTTPRA